MPKSFKNSLLEKANKRAREREQVRPVATSTGGKKSLNFYFSGFECLDTTVSMSKCMRVRTQRQRIHYYRAHDPSEHSRIRTQTRPNVCKVELSTQANWYDAKFFANEISMIFNWESLICPQIIALILIEIHFILWEVIPPQNRERERDPRIWPDVIAI